MTLNDPEMETPIRLADDVQLGKVVLWVRQFVPADQQDRVLEALGIIPAPVRYCRAGVHVRTPANTQFQGSSGNVKYCKDCNREARLAAFVAGTKKRVPTVKPDLKPPYSTCKQGHELNPDNCWVQGRYLRCKTCTKATSDRHKTGKGNHDR